MSPRDDGSYNIAEGVYKGVALEAPVEFWKDFDEKKLRATGFG